MFKKIVSFVKESQKTIVLTFELFWILVFFLDRLTSANSVEIPQFIYVNF